MTDNYEFALSKTKGQFILCMGDDDGLIVDSLQYVYNFIQKYDAEVVKSPVTWYYWPNSISYPESIMNFPFTLPVISIDSKSLLEKVANFELGYFNLPMIYYSFISRKIVDDVVAEKGSFFQNSASMDIYSGFVVAHKTKQFYISDKPFVIVGVSSKSTGASAFIDQTNNIVKEFNQQHNIFEAYKKHQIPLLPQSYSFPTNLLLELKNFAENYKITDTNLKIGTRKVLLNFLTNQSILNNVETLKFEENFREYDVYIKDIEFIKGNFLQKQLYFPFQNNNDIQLIHGVDIDPNIFGIKNVYDASLIFRKLVDGIESLKPIEISIQKAEAIKPVEAIKKPILIKRAYNRLKRAVNVLLGH